MLSLAIDNTNTPNRANGSPHHLVPTRGDDVAMASSQDEGATGRQPVDTLRAGRGRPGVGVTAGETATHSNSRAPSSRANKAGGGSSSPVAGTHPNLQAFSMPAELTGEGFPAILQPSPVIDFNSTGATVEAEMIASQAVSAGYSTWSPWSVCKGSI